MRSKFTVLVIASILILGTLGLSQNVFAQTSSADLSLNFGEHFCSDGDVQNIGDPCEWFFRIFNAGPDTAENISLLFFLPTGLEFLGDSNCQAVSAGLVICDISNTQPGVLRTGLIEFTATSELPVGLITVSAQVVSDTFDPNLDNNFASDVGEADPGGNLGSESVLPPPTEVTLVGNSGTLSNGVPVIVRGDAITYSKDVTAHCGGLSPLGVKLVVGPFSGSGDSFEVIMGNGGSGVIWEGTSTASGTGAAALTFYVDCPPETVGFPEDITLLDPANDETQDAGGAIWIDPSGKILDSCTGLPLEGATVTILVDTGIGFITAPAFSPPLAPAVNPQTTLIDGTYAWDVIPGTYMVEVSIPGWISASSLPLVIPPAVTDLDFVLDRVAGCPVISEPDHYLGYDVKETKHTDKFQKFTVDLSDQFEIEPTTYTVEKPDRLYNPVQKTHGDTTTLIADEISHYVGYKIKQPKGEPKFEKIINVLVQNQFGDIIVDVKKPKMLLVPSAKDHFTIPDDLPIPITVNHFKCYDVKESKDTPKFVKQTVTVFDPNFKITQDFEVKKPKMLCTPVQKIHNGVPSEIVDQENHLMCYDVKKMKGEPKFEKINVFTNNQFGPEDLEVKKQKELCVPSLKTLP